MTYAQETLDTPYVGLDDLDTDDQLEAQADDSEFDNENLENEDDELDIVNDEDDEPDDEDIPLVDATEIAHKRLI